MSTTQAAPVLTEEAVRQFVTRWYEALDRHDPVDEVERFLASEGLVMHFPEGTSEGLDGFRSWYDAVTHRFFDETHTVASVDTVTTGPDSAEVKVVVNWQTSVWTPPAARSQWLGFDAYQTWTVVVENGTLRIRTYTVDGLKAMPGSAEL
ncbi:nuclear transport factor 2 family protein [Streptomyces sp. NPDC052309]|uniref:Nuclear transport factor 2 family protein n=1 Tax=Streptomyces griseicoloratus TaxID=2752516 RepID=A0A926QQJ5_9ACTN|nr:nuclear transport factor 2 family protein [Streptomyces griseicoloratus]MBD0420428.1 nuclear transport factor 2 family protein [Streptomyces griseicoloratus]